jgi:RsiW-degrading membrane proteinase PrsW (M82 family)
MNVSLSNILFALLGGILPALFWLVFWLKEDKARPEPKRLVLKTFIFGMLSVIIVLPFQRIAGSIFPGFGLIPFLVWAILEEGFKFIAAYKGGLEDVEDDEPLDPMIYMITAALGFVALENTLFIINPILQKDIIGEVLTGNFRFIGASLLHVVSSSTIGASIALNFYRPKKVQILYMIFAFCLAVGFHTAFNLFILNQPGYGAFKTFFVVWAGVGVLFLLFEKIKKMKPSKIE